jgi:hypothetical protein
MFGNTDSRGFESKDHPARTADDPREALVNAMDEHKG